MKIFKILKLLKQVNQVSKKEFQLDWYITVEKNNGQRVYNKYVEVQHQKQALLQKLWNLY